MDFVGAYKVFILWFILFETSAFLAKAGGSGAVVGKFGEKTGDFSGFFQIN